MSNLILASSSPYRRELLTRLRIPFESYSPDIDESALENESFEAHVKRLSLAKAYEASKRFPEAICIGSDEIAGFEKEILGKPLTHDNAILQLKKISGKTITFYTGLAVVKSASHHEDYRLSTTTITFREFNDQMIENYLHKEKPYHSAASFKWETLGIALTKRFEGNDPTALIGLPLIDLADMLEKAGLDVLNNSD